MNLWYSHLCIYVNVNVGMYVYIYIDKYRLLMDIHGKWQTKPLKLQVIFPVLTFFYIGCIRYKKQQSGSGRWRRPEQQQTLQPYKNLDIFFSIITVSFPFFHRNSVDWTTYIDSQFECILRWGLELWRICIGLKPNILVAGTPFCHKEPRCGDGSRTQPRLQ